MDSDRPAPQRTGPRPWWLLFALVLLAVNLAGRQWFFANPPSVDLPYSAFLEQVAARNVTEVVASGDELSGTFARPVDPASVGRPAGEAVTRFETRRPTFAGPGLEEELQAKGVTVTATEPGASSWWTLLGSFGPTLLLVAVFLWMNRRMASQGSSGVFGLGRSQAKRYSGEEARVSFRDVAGIDEAENELVEIVDFLRSPERYQRLGGTMPKGVLLVGAPGTGKTLLARAIAGEANVPFFSLSASEFVEMIVGVGAARVRDLFQQARVQAPSIIFIDELDAVGRARGAGSGLGGHDEREQTLNQILTEMDGFDSTAGVIVLAATNRVDVLDPALLRPGRFDRRVFVHHPDRAGRKAILEVHTRRVPIAPDVSLDRIAAETPGLVGAELRNLVNEAALRAARCDAAAVRAEDFTEAMEKITLGPARNVLLNPADRERTAYHEAGHALLALLVEGDPLHRVTIVPRGMALGATWQVPVDDKTSYREDYLRARIVTALGGRASEQLVYGVLTSGAENDLRQVTEIARHMVLRWGMSERLGPVSFAATSDEGLPPGLRTQPYSEAVSEIIDAEVRRIVEECHETAIRLLTANRGPLDRLAHALLEKESLDQDQVRGVIGELAAA